MDGGMSLSSYAARAPVRGEKGLLDERVEGSWANRERPGQQVVRIQATHPGRYCADSGRQGTTRRTKSGDRCL